MYYVLRSGEATGSRPAFGVLTAVFVLLCSVSSPSYAQEGEGEAERALLKHHRIALFTGTTWVPSAQNGVESQGEVFVPTYGLDYEYWFSHTFALGLFNDFQLGAYIINTDEAEDLERKRAFVTTVVAVWEPTRQVALFGGAGAELEEHESFFVIKAGAQYEFPIGDWWDIELSLSYDWKEVYGSWSFGLAVGKRFGKAAMK